MKSVTIKDVAKEAGVSTTTVSHVINKTRYIDPQTKEKVVLALNKLKYRPNSIARSLRSGKTKTIGLIVPDASNLYFADISRKIEDFGYQHGYSVIQCNSDNNPEKQKSYINTLIAKQVDGVIFISSGGEVRDLESFSENNIPVVVADRDVPLSLADVVLLNNEQAGYDATKHLLDLGHELIECIAGPNSLSPSMQRVEGFRRALKEYGLLNDSNRIEIGDFRFHSGEICMERLLSKTPRPSAIFALNDMMAIGAMAAVRKAGLSIPNDISIVGFDDIELASAMAPMLTTIAQPIEEIARCATDLLIHRIEGKREEGNQRIILSAKLIVRESTTRHLEVNGNDRR